MDGVTMQQIRDVLLERRYQLGGVAAAREQRSADMADTGPEIIDIAQTFEQADRDKTIAEAERRELAAIERALAKMATGTFGYCEDCSEEIPGKRLLVLPEARLCASCQAFEEKQQARTRVTTRIASAR